MAATLVRLSFDQNGTLVQMVVPDDDSQLKDRAFSPPGLVSVSIAAKTYNGCATPLAVLQAAQPTVKLASSAVGAKLQTLITTMQQQATADTTDASGGTAATSA